MAMPRQEHQGGGRGRDLIPERTGAGEDAGGGEYEGRLVQVQGGPVELPPQENV